MRIKTVSPTWQEWRMETQIVSDLLSGQKTIKEKATIYLTRAPRELESAFNYRVKKTSFFNGFKHTVDSVTSRVFGRDIILNGGDEIFHVLSADIDMEGNNLSTFSRQAFKVGVAYGCSFIVVDFPKKNEGLKNNSRPFWLLVEPFRVMDHDFQYINNKRTLTYFKYETQVGATADGESMNIFSEYILEDGKVFFIQSIDQNGVVTTSEQVQLKGFDQIPVIPFMTNQIDHMVGYPPLDELAHKTIEHFNANSDYKYNLHMSAVPMMELRGWIGANNDDGTVKDFVISPNAAYEFSEGGGMEWTKGDAPAIQANKEHVDSIKAEMTALGLEPYAKQNETATGRAIDADTSFSLIRLWVNNLENALEKAFSITAMLLPGIKVKTVPEVEVNKSFTITGVDERGLSYLFELYRIDKLIDAETLINELRKRGLVSYGFKYTQQNEGEKVNG